MTDVWYVAQVVVSGITPGAIYALMALGFVLVHKATGVVNFAHGEAVMLSLGVIAIAFLLMAVLAVFFRWFRLGKAMRAVSENRLAASLMGISVPAVFSWTWGLSSLLAGASGMLIAPLVMMSPEMGFVAFKGFVAAILGGFTSIPGTIVGGLVMGILENLAGVFVSTAYKDVISFVFMITVLALRPAGLLGTAAVKKV